ncbi:hypothetical protein BDV12DRAFT_108600 [Aspergillus spectabilis]
MPKSYDSWHGSYYIFHAAVRITVGILQERKTVVLFFRRWSLSLSLYRQISHMSSRGSIPCWTSSISFHCPFGNPFSIGDHPSVSIFQ